MVKERKKLPALDRASQSLTNWIGTTQSLILHTFFFLAALGLALSGFRTDQVLLVLTTLVSLEAIYLAILIQMTVNRNTKSLEEVEADIDEIQEDVEELEEEVEDIEEAHTFVSLDKIESGLQKLLTEIESLKNGKQ